MREEERGEMEGEGIGRREREEGSGERERGRGEKEREVEDKERGKGRYVGGWVEGKGQRRERSRQNRYGYTQTYPSFHHIWISSS